MTVIVNGQVREVPAGTTVAAVVAELTGSLGEPSTGSVAGSVKGALPGIAVAVNDAVVHRGAWPTTALDDGDRVEVLTAVQGG